MKETREPPQFSKYIFWDCDISKIDYDRDKAFVIERVLVWGNENDEKELFKYYDLRNIRKAARHSINLNDRTISYLNVILGIPKEKFRCYRKKPYYQN
jgi:hypothetical protein